MKCPTREPECFRNVNCRLRVLAGRGTYLARRGEPARVQDLRAHDRVIFGEFVIDGVVGSRRTGYHEPRSDPPPVKISRAAPIRSQPSTS